MVLLPVAWLLSLSGQLHLVWWAFPAAELASLLMCAAFLRYVYRREILPLKTIQRSPGGMAANQ